MSNRVYLALGAGAAAVAVWFYMRPANSSARRVARAILNFREDLDLEGALSNLEVAGHQRRLKREAAGHCFTKSSPRVVYEAVEHIRVKFPLMSDTQANRLLIETEVLKFFASRDVRKYDRVRCCRMAVELALIPTESDLWAKEIGREMRSLRRAEPVTQQ